MSSVSVAVVLLVTVMLLTTMPAPKLKTRRAVPMRVLDPVTSPSRLVALLWRIRRDRGDQRQAGRDGEARAADHLRAAWSIGRGSHHAAAAERGQLVDADALGSDRRTENRWRTDSR